MNTRLINIREGDAGLHATFMEWWKAHDWPGVALEILPKCGLVTADADGTDRAVGFLYMDNSTGVSMLEWVVTNPKNTGKQTVAAIKDLVGAARAVAVSLDYGVMLTTAKQEALCRCYEKNGFTRSDTGMTHLVMFTKA